MPTAEITITKMVATGEEVTLPAPGIRAGGVMPHSGRATIDSVDQPATEFNVNYNLETIVAKNNSPVAWIRGAVLSVTWEDATAGGVGGGGDFLPLAGGVVSGSVGLGTDAKHWTLGAVDGETFLLGATSKTEVITAKRNGAVVINTNGGMYANFTVCNAATIPSWPFGINLTVSSNGNTNVVSGYLDGTNPAATFVITGYRNSNGGWQITMPTAEPKTGGNAGLNFTINGIDDLGATMPPALKIDRATSKTTLMGLVLNPLPVDALDDVAAATAGVPVGGLYCNGSVLMVRKV